MAELSYKRPEKMVSIADGIAHFLDWNAVHNPGDPIPMPIIALNVMGLSRRPNLNSSPVETCKKEFGKAKTLLEKKYGRLTIYKRSFGYRATINDEDKLIPVKAKAKIIESGSRRLGNMIEPIDESTFSTTMEGKVNRAYLVKLRQGTALLTSQGMRSTLLPPGSPDLVEDGKKKK